MTGSRQQQLQSLLLDQLPSDHSAMGNPVLLVQFQSAASISGLGPLSEDDFKSARDALVERGAVVKGKGRGGSTARATGAARPAFDLQAEAITPDMLASKPAEKARKPKAAAQTAAPGDPQVVYHSSFRIYSLEQNSSMSITSVGEKR